MKRRTNERTKGPGGAMGMQSMKVSSAADTSSRRGLGTRHAVTTQPATDPFLVPPGLCHSPPITPRTTFFRNDPPNQTRPSPATDPFLVLPGLCHSP